jgi:hypothetical protein
MIRTTTRTLGRTDPAPTKTAKDIVSYVETHLPQGGRLPYGGLVGLLCDWMCSPCLHTPAPEIVASALLHLQMYGELQILGPSVALQGGPKTSPQSHYESATIGGRLLDIWLTDSMVSHQTPPIIPFLTSTQDDTKFTLVIRLSAQPHQLLQRK